jgi:hypothetical protein
MMIQDFAALSEKLETLLQTSLGTKHLINPYFRISKGTPEQTKKYFLLNSNIPRPALLIWNLLLMLLSVFRLSLINALSLILFRQNSSFIQKIENTEVLFLSHGTKGNLLNSEADTFFDLIPQYIQSQKKLSCTVLYTNQNLFRFRIDNKLLDLKNKELKHILLPKILRFTEHAKYVFTTSQLVFRALLLSFRYYFEKPDLSRILICSIPWYFSRATYSNYSLLTRVKEVHIKNNLAAIFLTFEGHSFEQLIVDRLNEDGQKTNIFFYQHSPIVSLHYGIKYFLVQLKSKITILTSGVFYAEYFQSFSKLPRYKVIGTNKSKLPISNRKMAMANKIVYAPEGTNFATKDFVDLIKSIIKDSPEYSHYLRLHPDIKLNLRMKLELNHLRKYNNFFISSNNLESDLSDAKYLVYRSSAVGIEALKHDLLPIFYAEAKFCGLNVLISKTAAYYKAQNPTEILIILKSSQDLLSKDQRLDFFNSFFSKINYEILSDTI